MRIRRVSFQALNVPLTEPFGIATGAQDVALNVLVEVLLEDGTCGLGEAAPFPAVSGETQAQVLAALPSVAAALTGRSIASWRPLLHGLRAPLANVPSALAAVEMAVLDAWTRQAGVSLWSFFGGSEAQLRSDMTIVTGTAAQSAAAADRAVAAGFDVLKLKIGGAPAEQDLERVRRIAARHPHVRFILDANASLSAEAALSFTRELGTELGLVVLFEQPTPAGDLDALARVTQACGVPVAADESARSVRDVVDIARRGAAPVINIKTMKTGVLEAWDMMVTARALGLDLMVGGMVETELSMTVSACLGGGLGGVRFYDLDTPLFMGPRPLSGGFLQAGPHIDLSAITVGHGIARRLEGVFT